MTREELIDYVNKHHNPDSLILAYNLAIDHATEKATKIIDGGTTEFLIPNEILNLKITE